MGLSDIERYVFDTRGFVVARGLLGAEEVATALAELADIPTVPCPFENTVRQERLTEHCSFFRDIAEDPRIAGRAFDVINQPMRNIESYSSDRTGPSVLLMHNGRSETLHRPGVTASQNLNISHSYHDGRLYCMNVKAICYLTDVATVDDGPFCYVEGSHKANFPLLDALAAQGPYEPMVDRGFETLRHTFAAAGDVLLLNEALMHGTLRKTTGTRRTLVAFSYAPTFVTDYAELEGASSDLRRLGHFETTEERLTRMEARS